MFIPILISVFVGIAFKKLAENFNKSQGQYATFGVLWFLAGSFGVAFLLGLFSFALGIDFSQINQFILSIILYIVGGIIAFVYYGFLKKRWKTQKKSVDSELLDDVLIED